MINFYRDVLKKRSHILKLLYKLFSNTGKLNWRWGKTEQETFVKVKEMLNRHAILAYLDFAKPFDLYTDASNIQLGTTLENRKLQYTQII